MKNSIKALALTLLLAAVSSLPAFAQQNSLIQTTLAADVAAGVSQNPFGSSTTTVQVAAVAAGITGIQLNSSTTLNTQNQWMLYVDRELMAVVSVQGTTLQVQRGVQGTVASPHKSGTMVLFGRNLWFYGNDPGATPSSGTGVSGVSCTAASVLVTPYLNYRTGAQWICSTITNTYVPGWNNAGGDFFSQTATVASAAGAVTPSGPYFSISGALAITGFNIPLGFNGTALGGGCFVVNPTGIFTWTAAGNIAIAGTTTQALVLVTFCWNAATSKWVPSRIA